MNADNVPPAEVTTASADLPVGFWLLRMVLPGRWGRWLTGMAISGLLLALYALSGGLSADGQAEVGLGVVLFFALILGYIVPVHQLIITRSIGALDVLDERFPGLSAETARSRHRLLVKSPGWVARTLALGLVAGFGHNALLYAGSDLSVMLTHPPTALTAVVTLLIWIVMTAVISSLVENAVLFARLGALVPVDLLRIRTLTPFGSVAVSSTLAIIGAQAAFPFMFFQADVNALTFVPGLIATSLPMIYLFVAPVWPVHARIVDAKRQTLDRLDGEIAVLTAGSTHPALPDLAALLVYRREVSAVGEWPFDTSVMGRLILYLIIPPLTWVGAALIEMLVDTAF